MNKQFKQTFAAAAVALGATFMLVGCGSQDTKEQTSEVKTEQVANNKEAMTPKKMYDVPAAFVQREVANQTGLTVAQIREIIEHYDKAFYAEDVYEVLYEEAQESNVDIKVLASFLYNDIKGDK